MYNIYPKISRLYLDIFGYTLLNDYPDKDRNERHVYLYLSRLKILIIDPIYLLP